VEALLRRRRQRALRGAPDHVSTRRRGCRGTAPRRGGWCGGSSSGVAAHELGAARSSTRMGGTTTVAGPSSRADVELRDSPTPAARSGGRRWLRQQQPWWLGQLGRHAVEQACSGRAATQQAAWQSNTRQRQAAAWREGKANASKASNSLETRLRRAALLVAVSGKYLKEIRIECEHCSGVQQRQASGQVGSAKTACSGSKRRQAATQAAPHRKVATNSVEATLRSNPSKWTGSAKLPSSGAEQGKWP
jgi:hypothetical protein